MVSNLAAMGIETRQVEVPFEQASFDLTNVQRDRTRIDAMLFGDVDAIVLPTLTEPTPTVEEARRRGDMAVSPDNTFFCNYFGLPAVSVPMGPDKNGLPLGVQVVGPHDSDQSLPVFARAYQRAAGWRFVPPSLPGGKRSCLTLGVPPDGAGAPRLVQNGLEFPACRISTGLS